MTDGDVALVPMPQADGRVKQRPVILLRMFAPFGDWLICGLSTQLHQEVVGFDEQIRPGDVDFAESGLKKKSLIRLGFLTLLPAAEISGIIGSISDGRHGRLVGKLGQYIIRGTAF